MRLRDPLFAVESRGARTKPLTAARAAIAAYIQDRHLADWRGAAGLSKVSRKFDWGRCVDEYLAVYDELLGVAERASRSPESGQSRR
jgi:glycosyltransferase involved in cell wall biosynthesis